MSTTTVISTTTATHTLTQSQEPEHAYSPALEGLVEGTEDTAEALRRRRRPTRFPHQVSAQPRYVSDDTRPTTELATYSRQPGSARWPVAPPSQFPVPPTYRIRNPPPRPPPTLTQILLPSFLLLARYGVSRGGHPNPDPGGPPDPDPDPDPEPSRYPLPHSSSRIGRRKKALLIGTNYSTHPNPNFRLQRGVHDAYAIAHFLCGHLGFQQNNVRILTDDQLENLPTKANIYAAMRWLVEGARSGDTLFFYFSGHATRVKATNGDERRGSVTGICPMNYMGPGTPGIITDDHMHDVMVKPLPQGCRLTAVLDCPHSGVPLDLPYIIDTHGQLQLLYNPNVVRQKSSPADVISLSIRKDSAVRTNEYGTLRKPLIDYMMTYGNRGTYHDIIRSLCACMGYRQQPQLSSSHVININQQFIICE